MKIAKMKKKVKADYNNQVTKRNFLQVCPLNAIITAVRDNHLTYPVVHY